MEATAAPPSALYEFLIANPTVKYVHYHWTDYSGLLCERVIPKAKSISLATTASPVKVGFLSLIGLCDMHASRSFRPGGWDSLVPCWSSLRLLDLEHASVMCAVSELHAAHIDLPKANPHARCPRSVLESVLDQASANYHLEFTAGFEIEFYLLTQEECKALPNVERPEFIYLNGAQSLRGSQGKCVETCVDNLERAGISVDQFHAEAGSYQFEITTGPLPALAAVDALVQSLEIIRRTALLVGLRACFLPQPFPEWSTSGLHMHLSLVTPHTTLSGARDECFIGGILERLPGLCAISMPSSESYARIASMAAGLWVSWGSGNRDVPIRKVGGHWEFRTVDATANIYFAMAAYIAAGLTGLNASTKLTIGDCQEFVDDLNSNERERLGIKTALPTTLDSVADCYEQLLGDERFCSNLGIEAMKLFSVVIQGQKETLTGMSPDEVKRMFVEFF